jgi:hypothetical protein
MSRREIRGSLLPNTVLPDIESDEIVSGTGSDPREMLYRFHTRFEDEDSMAEGVAAELERLQEYFNWLLVEGIQTNRFKEISDKILLTNLHRKAELQLERCCARLGETKVFESLRGARLKEAELHLKEALFWKEIHRLCLLFGVWMFNGRGWWSSLIIWPLLVKGIFLATHLFHNGAFKFSEWRSWQSWMMADWNWVLFAFGVSVFAGLYRVAIVEEINKNASVSGVCITARVTTLESKRMLRQATASFGRLVPLLSRTRIGKGTLETVQNELKILDAKK